MENAELLRRRDEKIAEVEEDIRRLSGEKFKNLENVKRLDRMLQKEVELMKNSAPAKLESHLTTCNYAFYKSIINEIENTENVTAVLKTFRRDDVSVTVDMVIQNPHVWVKLVNRPCKTVLIEYRDGKRNGDVIAQLKQHRYVSKRFNKPHIRAIFKNGILSEMADKLSRHGVEVVGEKVEKEQPELRGKWNEAMMEKLAEDSDWDSESEEIEDNEESTTASRESYTNCLNLDISAVMLLVSNMCEPGGANFEFAEPMLNSHVADERRLQAKKPLLEQLKGKRLIMSKLAFLRVNEIVNTVGGPEEQRRFEELTKEIELIEDGASDEVGRVAKLGEIRGISDITKRVFSCAEMTRTKTVTANRKFLGFAERANIYFDVIVIPPRPLTEQKQQLATPI